MFKDDDQESLSSAKALERADHGKQDKLDQRKKLSKDKLRLQRQILTQDVARQNRGTLASDVANDPDLKFFDQGHATVQHHETTERQTSATRSHTNQDLQRKEEERKRAEVEAKQETQQEMG